MISRHYCLCLLAVSSVVCAASFTASTLHSSVVHGTHLRKKTHIKRSEEEEDAGYTVGKNHDKTRYGSHWHYSPSYEHPPRFTGTGMSEPGMVSAGNKENEQREGPPVHPGVIPLLSQQPGEQGSRSTAGSLDTALASASLSAAETPTSSVLSGSSARLSLFASSVQATHSPSSASALGTTPVSASSSSSSFQPALLAFILVPVCLFLLGMMFALYRIYGRRGNRLPPVSPLFLGDTAAARGSGYHRDEAISVNEPALHPRGSPLAYDLNKKGIIKWEPFVDRSSIRTGPCIANGSTLRTANASHLLKPPVPTHVTGGGRHNSPSRVLRPYVPRPYHRPHPANTDTESMIPLVKNNSNTNKTQGRYATPKPKGRDKENIPQGKGDHARKHRDDMSTTPLDTSPRLLPFRDPVISAMISDKDILPSSSSLARVTNDRKQLAAPPIPSGGTSFDIGLAMMSDFSSSNVGLGLDLSPRPPSPKRKSMVVASQTSKNFMNGSLGELSRDAALPYLEHSATVGNKGLADLSRFSREVTPGAYAHMEIHPLTESQGEQIEDELDIALALAVYKTHHAGDRLQAHQDLDDQKSEPQSTGTNQKQDSPISSESSGEARYAPTSVMAPTLPTLSEMALSRADPLYESVTNELFSSYGMRMSTANGQGRTSRVSARISKMLSWFADSGGSGNRNSVMENRMSCDDPIFSGEGYRERLSDVRTPAVQPLRIGKVRKNAV